MIEKSYGNSSCETSLNVPRDALCSGELFSVIYLRFKSIMIFLFGNSSSEESS